jgi:hypothetical protein
MTAASDATSANRLIEYEGRGDRKMSVGKTKPKRSGKKIAASPFIRARRSRKGGTKRARASRSVAASEPLTDSQIAPIPGAPTEVEIEIQLGQLSAKERQTYTKIRNLVARHLGSFAAARLWFVTVGPGYAMTPLQAVKDGRSAELLGLLANQWGRNPTYA